MPLTLPALRTVYAGTGGLLLFMAYAVQAAPTQAKPQAAAKPAATVKAPAPVGKLRYNRDIRPILADNCFACHGPDSAARKAGMRLDKFADATAARKGSEVIVPGNPVKSELIRRVTGQGPLMPPPNGHKSLTAAQIATLKRWISEGAQYELHWAYQVPQRGTLPPVSAKNAGWVRNPIDRFVLARLEKEGLIPAPEADRRTLARRVSLDLTGLPPDPADVDAFVADKSPNAYEKLVDKFLASPHWGEHRGRYWLDAARYADTHGIHMDNYREMWAYRDWVINAFNKNIPFDQFTIEQLAGDLLPNPTMEQRIATGFNRCNITSSEGGAIDEEYKVLYARDRTDTTSQVWLGTTLACAVCHDHKFDPFTQKDFYSLSAYFNNTTQAAMDGNIPNTPPIIMVPQEADRPRMEALQTEVADARKQVEARKTAARTDFDKWLAQPDAKALSAGVPTEGLKFHLPLTEGQGRDVQAISDGKPLKLTAAADPGWDAGSVSAKAFVRKAGSVVETTAAGDFEKDQPFSAAAWVKIPNGNVGGAIVARMDDLHDFRGWDLWLEGGRVGTHIISKWPENALKTVTNDPISAGQWHHVCITYGGGGNTASVKVYVDGVAKPTTDQANTLKASIRTMVPLKVGQRHTTSIVDGTAIQDVRLYGRALTADDVLHLTRGTRTAWLVSKGAAQLTAPEKDELFGGWLNDSDTTYRTLSTKVASLDGEAATIRARGTQTHVMQEKSEEAQAYILARGDYDKRKDPVKAITPAILPPLPADQPRNRLGLARWLVRPENPLTARVTVNRFWQEIFGQGIVRTPGDFGVNGELPSHPELLDWLAVDFRENGWDIKRFYKQIVMSATYRQAALITPIKQRKDPKNILLSRAPRFRMDAEMVRDYALASSGLLVPKLGGPSVKPYQPDGVWEAVAMTGSNTHDYKRDMGESLYRRSLYTFIKRSAPPASMDIFNAPGREVCTVRRERTDTPLQALVTLNDTQFIEAARILAQKALKDGGSTDAAKEGFIAKRLLARPFRAEEQAVVAKSLADLKSFYAANPKDAQALIKEGDTKADATVPPETLAAWTMLTNQLMNLDEVLNK
jgi:mono/diheme cytochrome c family protein